MLQAMPLGPLMMHYSGSHTKRNNMGDVRKLIHKGKVSHFGCLILANNPLEVTVHDNKVDEDKSNYLIVL